MTSLIQRQGALFQEPTTQRDLHQWFTPAWAADAIIEQEFGWLRAGHRVLEPACGDGAFLCATPPEIEALGVEIDPVQAIKARANSGREVILGNFLEIPLSELGTVDAVIGNPPFESKAIASFLDRSAEILTDGGEVGFILPAYILQTSSKVEQLGAQFSIRSSMLPRNLFPRLKLPLVFAKFTKDRHRRLFGFLLYREAQEIASLQRCWKRTLVEARDNRGAWYPVVRDVLTSLGGEADLSTIYASIQGKRPTENPAWREKVRQVLQHPSRFRRVGAGRYCLAALPRPMDAHGQGVPA
jgi:site-specific DNA-methyltransferase (adenine-specific)